MTERLFIACVFWYGIAVSIVVGAGLAINNIRRSKPKPLTPWGQRHADMKNGIVR